MNSNKDHIINAVKKSQFPELPAEVTINLKSDQESKLIWKEVAFTLIITKGSGSNKITNSENIPLKVKRPVNDLGKADQRIFNNYKDTFLTTLWTKIKALPYFVTPWRH